MSVFFQMLGRELPCNLLDLLGIKPLPLPAPLHDSLVDRLGGGGERFVDLHL
jgi:hypothetical protein